MRPYAADFGQGPSFRSAICRELHLIPSKAVADNKLDISVIKHSIPSEIEGIEYTNYLLFKGLTTTDLKGDRTCGNDILREAPWERTSETKPQGRLRKQASDTRFQQ